MKALRIVGWFFGMVPLLCGAQTAAPSAAPQQRGAQVLDGYQGGWSTELVGASTGTRDLLYNAPGTRVGLDAFRSERNTALVQGKGTLPSSTRQRLVDLRDQLAAQDPDGFDVHMASYYLAFPSPEALGHLDLAAQRERSRTELIGPQLAAAAQRGDQAALAKWSTDLRSRGLVAPGLWRVAEDLLASVDKNGILITAGEMDAYPAWALQSATNKRRDVLVVDERLLDDRVYRTRIWTEAGAQGVAPTTSGTFIAALSTASARPLFLSMALGDRIDPTWRPHLYVTGIAFRFSRTPCENIKDLEIRWSAMNKATDAGPLSQNYLIPASVLLKHYRSLNDEAGMARMERSLRTLGVELKAMDRLYRSGILQH